MLCVNLCLVSQHLGQIVHWDLISELETELRSLLTSLLHDGTGIRCEAGDQNSDELCDLENAGDTCRVDQLIRDFLLSHEDHAVCSSYADAGHS